MRAFQIGRVDGAEILAHRGADLFGIHEPCDFSQQPALFALKVDSRPATQRTVTGRYFEPSLLDALRRD